MTLDLTSLSADEAEGLLRDMAEVVSAKRALEDPDAPRAPEPSVILEDPDTAAAFEALQIGRARSNGSAPSDDGQGADRILALAKSGPVEEIDLAGDHLNAERFLSEYGHKVKWSPEMGQWFVWNGAWWEQDSLELAQELAKETIDGLRSWVGEAKSESEFKQRSRHYEASTRSGRRDGLLAIARTDRSIVVAVARLDRDPHLLACRNGTVNLRTGELLPADPAQLITRGVDVDYVPDARSEMWQQFLETVFDHNVETIHYVQVLMGYAITGEVGEHLLPDLYGTGANGKSTLVTAIIGVLREHAAIAPEGLLVEQKHEQHPERLAMLRGRRLVVSLELERRATLAEGLVKSITGGDRISARFLYGQRFDFEPTHTVVLVTNHMPRVRGTDEAIWRRLRVVPFTVTIPPADRIQDFGKLLAELHGEAILAWLVAGAVDYYRNGLREVEQVRQATFDYRQREDVFAQFLAECTIQTTSSTKVKALRAAWIGWAKAVATPIGRDQDFTEQLEAHGIELTSYQGSRFALRIGLLDKSPGSGDPVTPRDPSAGNSQLTHTYEKVCGGGLTRPHETSETAGQPLFTDDFVASFGDDDGGEPS
jgi:putative DNA primase/helicase